MPHESDNTRSGPGQFGMRALFVVTIGVAVLASLGSWTPAGGLLGILVVGGWWSWLAVKHGARRIAYYITGFVQGAVLASWFVFLDVDDHAACLTVTGIFCCSTLVTVWILRRMILQPTDLVLWKAILAAPYITAAALALGAFLVFEAYGISQGTGLSEVFRRGGMLLGLLLIGVPIGVTISLPVTTLVSIPFCLWLRAVAGVRSSPPSMSEFAKLLRRILE